MAISGDTAARPASATSQSHFALTVDLFERNDIEQAVDMLLELLDAADGDTEAEPGSNEDDFVEHEPDGPGCAVSDPGGADVDRLGIYPDAGGQGDRSYAEWHTLPANRRRAGRVDGKPLGYFAQVDEDDEDDDTDQCLAQEDIGTDHKARDKMGFGHDSGLGDPEGDFCLAGEDRIVAGSGIGGSGRSDDYGAGDADDAEHDQATNNVPMPPVHALEPNIFNGKREYLGHANLMTSFQVGGDRIKSADSGKPHRSKRGAGWPDKPGVPV